MRIGFSFIDLALGGAQTFLVQLAQGLASRGHSVDYFLYSDRSDPSHSAPFLMEALDNVAQPVRSPHSLRLCEIIQLDGYHSLRRKLPYLPAFGRIVETYHSRYSIRRSGPLLARHRVAISVAVQKELKLPSQVIYFGFPFPTEIRPANKEYDVAILGRLHPVKQHMLFLKICELLYHQRGSLSALIIGAHPAASAYQEQVDEEIRRLQAFGLKIYHTHDVPSDQVFHYLSLSRVLLVTSEEEGFGRMAVEALACRVPVVANPVGGLLEIIVDGECGFFARRNDPLSFTSLANRLLEDSQLCAEFGRHGRQRAEEHFSLEKMLDAYEALYRSIAGQG